MLCYTENGKKAEAAVDSEVKFIGLKKAVGQCIADWSNWSCYYGEFRYRRIGNKVHVYYFDEYELSAGRDPEGFCRQYCLGGHRKEEVYETSLLYEKTETLLHNAKCDWRPTMHDLKWAYIINCSDAGKIMSAANDLECDFDIIWNAYAAGVPLEDLIA